MPKGLHEREEDCCWRCCFLIIAVKNKNVSFNCDFDGAEIEPNCTCEQFSTDN